MSGLKIVEFDEILFAVISSIEIVRTTNVG